LDVVVSLSSGDYGIFGNAEMPFVQKSPIQKKNFPSVGSSCSQISGSASRRTVIRSRMYDLIAMCCLSYSNEE
jgi:hypothetical protein